MWQQDESLGEMTATTLIQSKWVSGTYFLRGLKGSIQEDHEALWSWRSPGHSPG